MKKLIITGTLLTLLAATPAFAADLNLRTNIGASATVRTQLVTRAKEKADQEIARRIKSLNELLNRANKMERISVDARASITAGIQAQITAMQALQAKIESDASENSTSSLKEDIKSITGSYRIFALIMPQGAITAAADRILAIAANMADLGVKIQARITATQASSTDVTAAVSALADFNAKVADAKVQAQAALTEVAALTPDNGDQTKLHANLAALKDARAKIQAAHKDLIAAQKDVKTIVKTVMSFRKSDGSEQEHGTTTATSSTSTDN